MIGSILDNMKNTLKICMISSSGGHLKELNELKDVSKDYKTFQIVEKDDFSSLKIGTKQYFVRKIDRDEKHFFINFLNSFITIHKIFLKEKPNVVITTGALIAFPACIIGKLRGAKIIYIESYARINSLSLTGKLVYRFSNLFIVQWEELTEKYKKAKFYGSLF